jgi:hypothetical protein
MRPYQASICHWFLAMVEHNKKAIGRCLKWHEWKSNWIGAEWNINLPHSFNIAVKGPGIFWWTPRIGYWQIFLQNTSNKILKWNWCCIWNNPFNFVYCERSMIDALDLAAGRISVSLYEVPMSWRTCWIWYPSLIIELFVRIALGDDGKCDRSVILDIYNKKDEFNPYWRLPSIPERPGFDLEFEVE